MSDATTPEAPPKTTLTVTIDGRSTEATPGELLIAHAEKMGTYIPRFCWHPRMREVGMCRMCLVEVDGPRGPSLQPACMLPVAEGMKVVTDSPTVKKAQDGVLEFLLVNHPLDCPVCDKGGECPLQDQTLSFGPGESRFVEEKRHYEKPISISDLVLLDRERCILCDRCTRFSKEVAGDPLIHFVNRGNRTEVNTFPDDPFSSYFSGNVVQICPVGALTAQPYRFTARPWDLDQVESTCTSCAVGCRVVLQSSGDRVTRTQGVDSDAVNWGWLCDKGRFDFENIGSVDRLTKPKVRKAAGEAAQDATWFEALERAASVLRNTPAEQIGVIGGARLTNEDAYAWAKLLKGMLRIDNVDAQLGDGLSPSFIIGTPQATINDIAAASAVVLLAPDLKEELPVLFLRVRDAAANKRVPMVELAPKATGLSRYVRQSLIYRSGEAGVAARALVAALNGSHADRQIAGVEADTINAAAATIAAALASGKGNGNVVLVVGRTSLSESAASIEDAASVLLDAPFGASKAVLHVTRRSNTRGAIDMGLAPGLLPGRVSLAAGLDWFREAWGNVPMMPGKDTAAMLRAAARGELSALVLLGADPLTDFPDQDLATKALSAVQNIVAIDLFDTPSTDRASVVLPAAGYAEKAGTVTNLEGRVSSVAAKVSAPGVARPDWMIAVELGARLGHELGFETVGDITDEIARTAPAYLGMNAAASTGNGAVAPIPGAIDAVNEARAAAHAAAGGGAAETAGTTDESGAHESDEAAAADDPVAGSPAVPPLVRLTGSPGAVPVPQPDSYSLRLVVGHTLYDEGTLVAHSPSLAKLAPSAGVHLHPGEIERHGLDKGGRVRVVSQRKSVTLAVIEDAAVARGTAFVPFGHVEAAAAALIDLDELDASGIVKVRLETVSE